MMVGVCRKKMCSMGRDVAGPIYLRSFIGLTRQAAQRALQSLIFQGRSRSYLRARATRNQEGYRLLAFNAEMIMGSRDMGDLVLRLEQPIDIW